MSNHWKYFLSVGLVLSAQSSHAQMKDTTHAAGRRPVYHINYWVTAPIIVAGGVSGALYLSYIKPLITQAEFNSINPNNVPSFDRASLHQDMSVVPTYDKYSQIAQITGAAMPLLLLADPDIRPDWIKIVTIGLEANMVALGIFTISPIGPRWNDRYRPLVYYPLATAQANGINQFDGANKNSWYSGHTASVAASAFFMAKVYCDYHPDVNPYIVYGLAAVPSLATGYIRFKTLDHFPSDIAMGLAVGVACGVVIPQLHRIDNDNVSMGFFSSPDRGTGVSLCYSPSK